MYSTDILGILFLFTYILSLCCSGVVMYKSIMLSNNERTPQVVRQAMLKLNLEGRPEEFSLAQMLPDKGITMMKNFPINNRI